MATVDQASNIYFYPTPSYTNLSIPPAVIDTDTTTTGNYVDTQGFESVTFLLFTGAYTDGDYEIILQSSASSGSGYVDAATESTNNNLSADAYLINYANFPYGVDGLISDNTKENQIFWLGYVGPSRYVRPAIISYSTTSGAIFGAAILLGTPHTAPTVLPTGNAVG
jgi:hypothetical protein